MKSLTKVLFIVLIINLVLFCSNSRVSNNAIYADEKGSILQEFLSYKDDVSKQAELVNKFNKKKKIQFLKEFFPNSTYDLGLDSYGTVTPNGLIIIDEFSDDIESELQFVKWEIINDEIVITSENIDLLGYNKMIANDYYFQVGTIKRGGKDSPLLRKEYKYLILKFKIRLYIPERSKLLQDDEYDYYNYVGHGPATDKIKEYYKKMGWKTK